MFFSLVCLMANRLHALTTKWLRYSHHQNG